MGLERERERERGGGGEREIAETRERYLIIGAEREFFNLLNAILFCQRVILIILYIHTIDLSIYCILILHINLPL